MDRALRNVDALPDDNGDAARLLGLDGALDDDGSEAAETAPQRLAMVARG